MRFSKLVLCLLLLVIGFGYWVWLTAEVENVPAFQASTESGGDASSADAEQTPDGAHELARINAEQTKPLPSAAWDSASGIPGGHLLLLDATTMQPLPGTIVGVFDLPQKVQRLWGVETWGLDAWRFEPENADDKKPRFLLQADATGMVSIPSPETGFGIIARQGDFFGFLTMRQLPDDSTVELLLWPDRSLTIAVVDQHGTPMAGIEVGPMQANNYARFLATAKTDAQGLAFFPHLTALLHGLTETPVLTVACATPWPGTSPAPVPLQDFPERILLQAPATTDLLVSVEHANGSPYLEPTAISLGMAGGSFGAQPLFPYDVSRSVRVTQHSQQGKAVFKGVDISTDLVLTSRIGNRTRDAKTVIPAPRVADSPTVVVLRPPAGDVALRFRVFHEEDKPAANTDLTIKYQYGSDGSSGGGSFRGSSNMLVTTDAEGRFSWILDDDGIQDDKLIFQANSIRCEFAGDGHLTRSNAER